MPLFEVANRAGRSQDASIAKKSKKKSATTIRGGGLLSKINLIKDKVETNLGEYKDDYEVIRTTDHLQSYLMTCYSDGVIAIDTETTGLDPLVDKCVGISLYSPSNKPAYIPINHISYVTGVRVEEQLTEKQVEFELKGLEQACNNNQIKIIMFNAKFDIRVLRHALGVYLTCYWDCYLAAKLMNENETTNALKPLHKKYVLEDKKDAFTFDELFKGITFDKIPINVGYLYAAHDAIITYELYEYQKQYLYYDESEPKEARNAMNGVAWVFFNIEMPCVNVVADMEDTGVLFDFDYNTKLKDKYHSLLEERLQKFYLVCEQYDDEISSYRRKHGINCKLENPINIKSSTQLAILLYDVIGCDLPKSGKRSTDKEALESIDNSIAKAILDYREFSTIVNTFIDNLPEFVNKNDGRIHCSFNQYGAKTGRFSSSDPNLQNIPSHNKDIRPMFTASEGYVLMSSDYSQQEPKVMTQMCQDEKMLQAYKNNKDLYAEIASLSFNKSYEDCLEFYLDENGNKTDKVNKEGKERRSQAKSILLGVLYGRGVPSIAEQLGTTTEKAQAIKDSVFRGFPAIPKFENDSLDMAYEKGYVTTLWGRKRRLPDLSLDEFEFKWKKSKSFNGDVLDFDFMPKPVIEDISQARIDYYTRKLNKAWGKEKRKIFEEANEEEIWIIDNGSKIADAERQVVNSRIQGSAADMTKLAMILLGNDERLKELGFRMLIQVHDELIAECPEENAKECKERFAMLMSKAAESALEIPISCDVEVTRCWYGEAVKI